MAINPESQYPTKITPSSSDYPYGQARNITVPGDGTGTPWEQALVNDIFGFQQALLIAAGIVPSGTADKVGASQYLDCLNELKITPKETVALMTSDVNVKEGQYYRCEERGNGIFKVITGTGTADTYGIIAHDTLNLSFEVVIINEVVDVSHFGADPSNGDNTGAINAAADKYRELATASYLGVGALGASPHHVISVLFYIPPGKYTCAGSIWFGADTDYRDFVKNIYALGATLVSTNTGGVAVDMSGAYGCRYFGLSIWGDITNTPDVGLLCARLSSGESAGKHRFVACKMQGYYNVAAYYNYGAEVNRWTSSELRNIKSGGESTLYFTSSNGIQNIVSPNATLATGYQSSYSDVFSECDVHFDIESNNADVLLATNAPIIVESVDFGPRFYVSYVDVLQGGVDKTPVIRIRRDPALSSTQERNEGVALVGCTIENDYDSLVRLEANSALQHLHIDDCSIVENAPESGDIVVETGADLRRYKVQKFKGSDKEEVSFSNSGTLLEAVDKSGFASVTPGSTWNFNEGSFTRDGNWHTLDVRVAASLPRGPEKLAIRVRAKTGAQGQHDGADNVAVLTDTGASFPAGALVGGVVNNITDGSSGTITANTATTVTATLAGGTDNDWDIGDQYTVILSISDDNKLELRGSPADANPADFMQITPKVNNVFEDAEGLLNTAGIGSDTSGTHDGANNASVLSDSTASFTTNEFVGLIITNTTDGSSGLITANTATTITATLSGGTDNDWDNGDAYTIDFIEGSIQIKAPDTILELDLKVKGYYL